MPLKIVRNDITKMNTDAIVNTANENTIYGPGCDVAIYKAAGADKLLDYRRERIGVANEGEVFITPGFDLPAKYIIHAVSPRYIDGQSGEEDKLRDCYRKSLALAAEYDINSIAFPLIATGSFGYPKEEGLLIAMDEINSFLVKHNMLVYLVVFDSESTTLGASITEDLKLYIDQRYVSEKKAEEYSADFYPGRPTYHMASTEARPLADRVKDAGQGPINRNARPAAGAARPMLNSLEPMLKRPKPKKRIGIGLDGTGRLRNLTGGSDKKKISAPPFDMWGIPDSEQRSPLEQPSLPAGALQPSLYSEESKDAVLEHVYDENLFDEFSTDIKDRMQHMSDTFSEYLFYLIEQRGYKNDEVWKRSIVDKKVFSKIKNNPDYHPKKITALCLCVGMKLNLDETKDLLARAGYALSPCDRTDLIFEYFIERGIYDMIEIDIQLEENGLDAIIA